jgi:adenylylsulfate kinase-like enzyme
MINVCPGCGEYSDERTIDPAGPFAICPHCGHRQRFLRVPLFVITGASGTGKSTLAISLARETRDWVCFDTDILWRSEFDTPEDGYQAFRNLALRVARNISQAGRPVVLMAGGTPDQFEASPERRYFSEVHYLALVCDDSVLVDRLQARPAWRMSDSPEVIEQERSFNRWLRENASKTVPPMTLIDTGAINQEETARRVATWISLQSAPPTRRSERQDRHVTTVPVMLVTGPTGVGKSQVVAELSRMLDQAGVRHSRLDWDTLTNGIAKQPAFVVEALASIWDVHRRARATRLLLAASLERTEMLRDISAAIDGARIRAFCLTAPPEEVAARLRYRERGGLSEEIFVRDIETDFRVYRELGAALETVDTLGRTATEVASDILRRSGWVPATN